MESAVSSEHAGVTSQLTSFYRWGQRQVNSQDSAEKRGPGVTLPCGLLTPVSLFLSFSFQHLYSGCSWAQRLGRSAAYLRGHPAVYEGGEISFTTPPHRSSGQWLMKLVPWQVRMSSLGLVWGPCPVLMKSSLAPWFIPMHAFFTDIFACSFLEEQHVPLCLKAKVHAVSIGFWPLNTSNSLRLDASLAATQRQVTNGA